MVKKLITFILLIVSCFVVFMLGGCGSKSYNYSYNNGNKENSSSKTNVVDLTNTVNVIFEQQGQEFSRKDKSGDAITTVKVNSYEVVKSQVKKDVVQVDVTFWLEKTFDSKDSVISSDKGTQTCSFILKMYKDEGENGTHNFVRAETKKSAQDLMMKGDVYTYAYSFLVSVSSQTERFFKIELFNEIV